MDSQERDLLSGFIIGEKPFETRPPEPSTTATVERLEERIVSVLTAGESLSPQRTIEDSLLT